MIKRSVTPQDVCDVLNDAAFLDPRAVHALVESRVPCNEALACHPTIQVAATEDGEEFRVGLLGILNGIFGVNDNHWGRIAAEYNDIDPTQGIRFMLLPLNVGDDTAETPQHTCSANPHRQDASCIACNQEFPVDAHTCTPYGREDCAACAAGEN